MLLTTATLVSSSCAVDDHATNPDVSTSADALTNGASAVKIAYPVQLACQRCESAAAKGQWDLSAVSNPVFRVDSAGNVHVTVHAAQPTTASQEDELDVLRGGIGNDGLSGDAGADDLQGDQGIDFLNAGVDFDPDALNGGADFDTCISGLFFDAEMNCEL